MKLTTTPIVNTPNFASRRHESGAYCNGSDEELTSTTATRDERERDLSRVCSASRTVRDSYQGRLHGEQKHILRVPRVNFGIIPHGHGDSRSPLSRVSCEQISPVLGPLAIDVVYPSLTRSCGREQYDWRRDAQGRQQKPGALSGGKCQRPQGDIANQTSRGLNSHVEVDRRERVGRYREKRRGHIAASNP